MFIQRNNYTTKTNAHFRADGSAIACPGCNRMVMVDQLEPACDCCCEARCHEQAGACSMAHAIADHRNQPFLSTAWSRLAALFQTKGHSAPARS